MSALEIFLIAWITVTLLFLIGFLVYELWTYHYPGFVLEDIVYIIKCHIDMYLACFDRCRVHKTEYYLCTRDFYGIPKSDNRYCVEGKLMDKYIVYVNGECVKKYKYWLQVVTYCLLHGYIFSGVGTDEWNIGRSVVALHPKVKIVRLVKEDKCK